jgi:hypothetical protein
MRMLRILFSGVPLIYKKDGENLAAGGLNIKFSSRTLLN